MLRLAADEDFNGDIVRGLIRRCPGVEIIRVQDAGLSGMADPVVLAWCGIEQRILLTHDVRTMIAFAYERVARQEAMPGIVVVAQTLPIGQAIDDLALLVDCSNESEWEGQVLYLPLR